MPHKVLGLIPARAGSKGIPDKNIVPLGGKPLICWTLDAARESCICERIIVSTDSQKIANVAKNHGAEVPFLRPRQFSTDSATTVSVARHCLNWLCEHEMYSPEYLLVLQPTSPFRTAQDIINAFSLLDQEKADAVVSVCLANPHPCISMQITPEGYLKSLLPSTIRYTRRQDMPVAYALNGAVYFIRVSTLLEQKTFLPQQTRAYIMPQERSLDIDSPWDLYLSQLILEGAMRNNKP